MTGQPYVDGENNWGPYPRTPGYVGPFPESSINRGPFPITDSTIGPFVNDEIPFASKFAGAWFYDQAATIEGVVYDERRGLDPEDAKNAQLENANCLTLDGTNDYIAANLSDFAGPELVTNGDFSDGTTGWTSTLTVAVVSGELQMTRTGSGQRTYQSIATTAGKTYLVQFSYRNGTTSSAVYVGTTVGGVDLFPITTTSSATTAQYTFVFTATSGTSVLQYGLNANTSTAFIDNVSVKELPVLAHDGTSTISYRSAGNGIAGTAGTVFNLTVGTVEHLPCAEGSGLIVYGTLLNQEYSVSGGQASNWTTFQDEYHYNTVYGFSKKAVFPVDFNNWNIPVNVYINTAGEYFVVESADDYMPVTDQVFYVDWTNGNDSNNGLSSATPKLTIGSALSAATGVPRVLLARGSYDTSSVSKSCILEGNGSGNWQLDAERTISADGITVGFRNFTANYAQIFTGASTAVFDAPVCQSVSTRAIRAQGASKAIVFDGTGTGCLRDVLSYDGTAMGLEANCVFETHGSQETDNISTAHGDSRVVTVGGTYRDSFRNVHDIERARRVMFGTVVNTSRGVAAEGTSFNIGAALTGTSDTRIWLFGVDARGGATDDLFTATGGTIFVDQETQYGATSAGATITDFTSKVAYIPASRTNPTLDILGNPLTNPPVIGLNGSESEVNFSPVPDSWHESYSIPGAGIPNYFFNGDPGDIDILIDTASREARFRVDPN
jgi:hypothetical protein